MNKLFGNEPTTNQKAWGLVHQFYHLILTEMDKNNITKIALAEKLGKSEVYKMFHKTPTISIMEMVEIADAVGIELNFNFTPLNSGKE